MNIISDMIELEKRLCRFKITVLWTSTFKVYSKAKTKNF